MRYDKLTVLNEIAKNTALLIDEVNEKYAGQPASVLQRPAKDGGWSIVQCLEHLNTYSAYYLPHITKAVQFGVSSEGADYRSSWLGNYFTQMMKGDSSKKKYKAIRRHQPAARLNADDVLGRFVADQNRFLQLIGLAKAADLDKGRIPVSIFPLLKLNLGDVLQFMDAHQQRHLMQARRNYRFQTEKAVL